MEPLTFALGLLLLAGIGTLLWQQRSRGESALDEREYATLQAKVSQLTEQIGKQEDALERERSEKDQLKGGNKELFARHTKLEAELQAVIRERDELNKKATKTEAEHERKEREHAQALQKLDEAKSSLESERKRVIREDEERTQREKEQRDRMWSEHENSVVSLLSDLCSKPEFKFTAYDNTSLPEDFDGSLKPDFLVDFLGQYIVFDAKVSRSDNFQNYIRTQVQSTVKKVKNNAKIASTIFLVVPTEAISDLKTTHFYEQGFTIFVVSPESLPPILGCLKKITAYELADQFDPEERESIINWIAKLDFHINARNTFDIMLSEMGAELLGDTQRQNPDLAREVEQRKEKMRVPSMRPSEMKRLVSIILTRQEKIDELTAPRAAIEKQRIS